MEHFEIYFKCRKCGAGGPPLDINREVVSITCTPCKLTEEVDGLAFLLAGGDLSMAIDLRDQFQKLRGTWAHWIKEEYHERCESYDGCGACEAWAAYDKGMEK